MQVGWGVLEGQCNNDDSKRQRKGVECDGVWVDGDEEVEV